MLKHEVRLIDPDPDGVAGALSAAAVLANAGHPDRHVPDDPGEWRRFARQVGRQPDGWQVRRGGRSGSPPTDTSFVTAGWWTDPFGRKHVAARGWAVGAYFGGLFARPELDRRPPLWHVYPEFCFLRHDRDGTHLICACGCGAVGTPATVGWVGDQCGPCFDRTQDGGRVPAGAPGVLRAAGPLDWVVCSPDGNVVTAGGLDVPAAAWNLAAGAGPAAVAAGLRAAADEVRLPDPGLALAVHAPEGSRRELRLVRVPSREVVRSIGVAYEWGPIRLAVSADGAVAAVVHDRIDLVDLRGWAVVGSVPAPPGGRRGGLGFSPDGSRLFVAGGLDVLAYDTSGWRQVARGTIREAFGPGHRKDEWVRRLAIDPAGEAVYLAGAGPVFVFDPATLALRAVLDWHLGAVNGLALSADGERLFTAGADGCVRVWPVRRLLEGCEAGGPSGGDR